MSDPSAPLQKAHYEALTADATLAVLMGGTVRVFDIVGPGTVFPYITIGDDQAIDAGSLCEPDIFEVFSTLHVWSRSTVVGRVEAKRIAERIREILKTFSGVTGFTVTVIDPQNINHLRDPDGLTSHSIVTMRYVLTIL